MSPFLLFGDKLKPNITHNLKRHFGNVVMTHLRPIGEYLNRPHTSVFLCLAIGTKFRVLCLQQFEYIVL